MSLHGKSSPGGVVMESKKADSAGEFHLPCLVCSTLQAQQDVVWLQG